MCEVIGGLWLSPGRLQLAVAKHQLPCRIASRTLCCWVQSLEEGYECRRLGRTQVVPISRHVTAPLDDLPDELVLGEAYGNAIQCWPPLSPGVSQRMAVAALLHLK